MQINVGPIDRPRGKRVKREKCIGLLTVIVGVCLFPCIFCIPPCYLDERVVDEEEYRPASTADGYPVREKSAKST